MHKNIYLCLLFLMLSPDLLAKKSKRRVVKKQKQQTYIGLGLRSPDILPISLTMPVSKRLGFQIFGAPPYPMKQKNKIDPTSTEASSSAAFTTAGTEVDVDIQYGFHAGLGLVYRSKTNLYIFSQLSYRETSMAITGQESVSFETDGGSIDNIASANIAIDVLYQQFSGAVGLEKRKYFSRNTFIGFQLGVYLPLTTQKSIESQFTLNRLPSDSSLSSIFADSEGARRSMAEDQVQDDLSILEDPLPVIGIFIGQAI